MEPYLRKNTDLELGCYIDEKGIIQLRMSGNLSSDYEDFFLEWDGEVRKAMITSKERDPENVYCVIDITGKSIDTDRKMLSHLINLMSHNKDYVTRTGVYGANFFAKSLIDIALKAVQRNNMKMFGTHEEAMAWVLLGKE